MADPIFTDLDGTFTPNPITHDIGRLIDEQAIRQSIFNLVDTDLYERPFRSNISSGVKNLLFDQITATTATIIRSRIENVIKNYEKRVVDVTVEVNPVSTQDGYDIVIRYLPVKSTTRSGFRFFLERSA